MATNLPEFNVGIEAKNPEVSAAAAEWNRRTGLAPRPASFNNVTVNVGQAKGMAKEFLAAPDFDPAAVPHFRAMADETRKQYEYLTTPRSKGGMGFTHEVTKDDPYKTSREMMNDVANGRIKTLATSTTGSHPYFTDQENDMFRAVHDVFGHAGAGRNFNAAGEEAAFRSHYSMFSAMARPAMATETRGQNSTNNFGGLSQGQFAPNKIALLRSTGLILPPPRQLVRPGSRPSRSVEAQGQASAIKSHAQSYGTPGKPHPDASWLN